MSIKITEELKWMATDSDGKVYLYPSEPFLEHFPHNGNPNEYSCDYIGIQGREFIGCEFIGCSPKTDLTKEECLASLVELSKPLTMLLEE